MGSSDRPPERFRFNDALGEFSFGKELLTDAYKGYSGGEGLPPELKKLLMDSGQRQLGASFNQGKQDLSESVAGMGGLPADAVLSAQTSMRNAYTRGLKDLNTDVAFKDFDIKNQLKNDNFGRIMNLYNTVSGQAGQANAYNMGKYQVEQDSKFDWGDALGGALGAGGTIAGAGLSRKGRR